MALKNDIVLVTGGASGIGKAVCQLFAEEGARVVPADINEQGAHVTVNSLKGNHHFASFVDVREWKTVEKLADAILEKYNKPPNIVVNCAAKFTYRGPTVDCPEEAFDVMIDTMVKGTFNINKKFIGLLKNAKLGGSIINFSSISSDGTPNMAVISCAKAAVESFSKAFASEVGDIGIRVNVVKPGIIDTPLSRSDTEEVIQGILDATPMHRMGEPREAAELCLYLASHSSRFMTGAILLFSGGLQH